jgi:hypothetical protein
MGHAELAADCVRTCEGTHRAGMVHRALQCKSLRTVKASSAFPRKTALASLRWSPLNACITPLCHNRLARREDTRGSACFTFARVSRAPLLSETRQSAAADFRRALRFRFPRNRCTSGHSSCSCTVASCPRVSRGLARTRQSRRAVARSENQVRRVSQTLLPRRRVMGDWLNGLRK